MSDEWYTSQLDNHIAESRRHVVGDIDNPSSIKLARGDTIVPPNTTWTVRDKRLFFASLNRHSTLRPDLVAAEVGKTEGQVCDYLYLLENGSEALKRTDGKNQGWRDRRARWEKSLRWLDGSAPAAREVSDEWVDEEERLSGLFEREQGDVIDFKAYNTALVGTYSASHAAKVTGGASSGKVAEDNTIIDQLSALDDRTDEQRRTLSILLNRKRNREGYRMKLLVADGMTVEEIEKLGGADAVFATRRPPRDEYRERVTVEREDKTRALRHSAEEKGWDVFNYERMGELSRSLGPNVAPAILDALRNELEAYLVPLVHHSIVLAQDEVTMRHVDQALALRGEDTVEKRREVYQRYTEGISGEWTRDKRAKKVKSPGMWWNGMFGEGVGEEDHGDEDEEDDSDADTELEAMDEAFDKWEEQELWDRKSNPELLKTAVEAQKVYESSLVESSREQRWKRCIQHRSTKFPTTRLRIAGGRLRLKQFIADSESEVMDLESEEGSFME